MKKVTLSAICALIISVHSGTAATITETEGIGLDVSAGFSLQGLEALFNLSSVVANQMRFTVFSEFGASGSVLSSQTLPFAATSGGGIFLAAEDTDGDVSVVVSADFGSFDFSFSGSSWDSLNCTGMTASTCANAGVRVSVDPTGAYAADISAVPLTSSIVLLSGALVAFGTMRRRRMELA